MAERQYRTVTKGTVDRLSVDGKDDIFWDDDLPGFGVRAFLLGRESLLRPDARLRPLEARQPRHSYKYILAFHSSLHQMPAVANRAADILVKMSDLSAAWSWRPSGSNPCRSVPRLRVERQRAQGATRGRA